MDRSKVEQLLLNHTRRMADFLGFEEWTIATKVDALPGDTCANCHALAEYRQATIVFDADKTPSEDVFLDYLAHEMFHIATSPLNHYLNIARCRIGSDMTALATDGESCRFVAEMIVSNLEVIWRRHLRDAYLDWFTTP